MIKKMFYLLRALQIVSLVVVCIFISYQFKMLWNTANQVKYQQTEKFANALTDLAAAEATRYLANNQQNDLQLLIENLSEDPIVRDATIYDDLGQVLYQSENITPLANLLNIKSQNTKGITPYVAELYNENQKIGYIRITLEQAKILSLIQEYQDKGMSTMILLLSLSFLAGTILMAMFFRRLKSTYYYTVKKICRIGSKIKSFEE